MKYISDNKKCFKPLGTITIYPSTDKDAQNGLVQSLGAIRKDDLISFTSYYIRERPSNHDPVQGMSSSAISLTSFV